jgi:hypothetical protein
VLVPEGATSKSVEKTTWALGGQLLASRATNLTTGVEQVFFATYDRQKKVYRAWQFDSQGAFPKGEMTGTWDEAAQSFHWTLADGDGVTAMLDVNFPSRDTVKWTGTWTDQEGRVLMEMDVSLTRTSE